MIIAFSRIDTYCNKEKIKRDILTDQIFLSSVINLFYLEFYGKNKGLLGINDLNGLIINPQSEFRNHFAHSLLIFRSLLGSSRKLHLRLESTYFIFTN